MTSLPHSGSTVSLPFFNSSRRLCTWGLSLACLALLAPCAHAQQIAETTGIAFPRIGKIQPRHAKDISGSLWSIGGETIDRDYTVYDNFKAYLGPLGAKRIRLQGGWARTEKVRGRYDWAWLDAIVEDCVAQGVRPWLQLSYGNPLYPNGGGIGLGDGIPMSEEALAAWDKWARALVARYKKHVNEWEVWNEPDINRKTITPALFADFFIRTAEIIRSEQPQADINALGLGGQLGFARGFLESLQKKNKLHLVNALTVHGYPRNPDDMKLADSATALVREFSPKIAIRQGETGAPSAPSVGALSTSQWSETKQAKWDTRRMLVFAARDMPFNLFKLMEAWYTGGRLEGLNTKGLLKANPDKTVAYAKPAYHAAQHVTSLFDDSVHPIANFPARASIPEPVAIYGFRQDSGPLIVTLWLSGAMPVDETSTTPIDVTLTDAKFLDPVLADIRTGVVYELPKSHWASTGTMTTLKQIPIYDSPIVIADRSAVLVAPGGATASTHGER